MSTDDLFFDEPLSDVDEHLEVSRHDQPTYAYEESPRQNSRSKSSGSIPSINHLQSSPKSTQFQGPDNKTSQNLPKNSSFSDSKSSHSSITSSKMESPSPNFPHQSQGSLHFQEDSPILGTLSMEPEPEPSRGLADIEAFCGPNQQQTEAPSVASHPQLHSLSQSPTTDTFGQENPASNGLSSQNIAKEGSRKMHTSSSQQIPKPSIQKMDVCKAKQTVIPIDEESDDDLMVIEQSAASAEAKSRWRRNKNREVPQDKGVAIKKEPQEAPPTALSVDQRNAKMLADQMAMLNAANIVPNVPHQQNPGPRVVGGLTLPQVPQRSRGPIHGYFGNATPIVAEGSGNRESPVRNSEKNNFQQIDAAMGGTDHFNEDDDWMNGPADEDDDEELRVFRTDMRLLELLGKKKLLTPEEKLMFNKTQNKYATKDRVKNAAARAGIPADERLKMEETVKKAARKAARKAAEKTVAEETTVEGDDDEDNVDDDDNDVANSLFLPKHHGDEVDEQHDARSQAVAMDDLDVNNRFTTMMEEAIAGGLVNLDDHDQNQDKPQDFGLTKAGKPRKRRAKAKNAREVMKRQDEERREKERRKAQKKKDRESKAGSSRDRKASSLSKSKEKGKKKENRDKKSKGKGKAVVKNGESLLHSTSYNLENRDTTQMMLDLVMVDPMLNRISNPIFNADPEVEIVGKQNKESQFSILFTNIPDQEDIGGMGGGKKEIAAHKKALREASKAFGYARVTAESGKWRIKGMRSTLYHHQLLGAQWMVQRELNGSPPHGGLLADAMGLGKTVQMLACMVANPPTVEDLERKTKATLIVVPAAVIEQWMEEIRIHVDRTIFPKVFRYKKAHSIPKELLEDCDIVVASYNDVMRELPYPTSKEEKPILQRMGFKNWWKDAMTRIGVLHQVKWHRIVLDEAQAIKNHCGRTSIACCHLISVCRWCLSGTPLLNRLEELYPYLKFLKADYALDWQTFRKYFCDPDNEDCYSRITTILSYTMMRRTMATTILNRPIITLPKPHPHVRYVDFSKQEEIIYRITENRFRHNLNKYFKKSEPGRNYSVFMVQLLRLRQCTSHPFMLEGTIKEMWTMDDVEELKKKLNALGDASKPQIPFFQQCKTWVQESEARRQARRDAGEPDEELLPFGASDFGYKFNMNKALESLDAKQKIDSMNCGICQDLPIYALQTDCSHIFCEHCISNYMHEQALMGSDQLVCPSCNMMFGRTDPVILPPGIRADDDMDSPSQRQGRGKGKGRGKAADNGRPTDEESATSKGKDALNAEPHTKNSEWITRSDTDPDFPLVPSAKTMMLKSILLKGFDDAPEDKVVIYVQFRALARIVGRICNAEKWKFLYLTGDLSLDHRTKVIKMFREDPEVKILVAGLKCGGLGLNFPWANRCISLDLWWNHAVEQQAFCRIFRIGQMKETHMTRIVVHATVDMRMLVMQLHKLKSLEKAMRDGVENRSPKLTLNQLANLFGFLKTDEDDNIMSVEADYAEDGESSNNDPMDVDEE